MKLVPNPMARPMRALVLAALLSVGCTFPAAGQNIIYIVRHAEKARDINKDDNPPLTGVGQKRAQDLVATLKGRNISRIYVSEKIRTQQTAAPFAKASNLSPTPVPKAETARLVSLLKSGTGNALVVGHSDTIPEVIVALGLSTSVKEELERYLKKYDNLFVLTLSDPPVLARETYPAQPTATPRASRELSPPSNVFMENLQHANKPSSIHGYHNN